MTASAVGYEYVWGWVKAMVPSTHATVVETMAWAVCCACWWRSESRLRRWHEHCPQSELGAAAPG